MADELRQRLIVELNGPGNLPKQLGDSAKQAREASKAVKDLRKDVDAYRRGQAAMLSANALDSYRRAEQRVNKELLDEQKKAREQRQALKSRFMVGAAATFAAGSALTRSTVSQYAPAAADRFDWALKDFGAAIGRDMLPSLEKATRGVYELQEAYLSLSPETRKAIADTIFYGTILAGGVVVYKGLAFVVGSAYTATRGLVVGLRELAGALGLNAAAAQRAALANATAGGASGMLAAGAAGGLLARGGRFALRAGLPAWLAYEGMNLFGNKGDEFGGLGDKLVGSASRTVEGFFRKIFQGREGFEQWRQRANLIEDVKWGRASPEQIARYQKMNETGEERKGGELLAARPPAIFGGMQEYLHQVQLDILGSGPMAEKRDRRELIDALKTLASIMQKAANAGMVGGLGGVASVGPGDLGLMGQLMMGALGGGRGAGGG
jgi:hypothetical protein